MTTDALARGRAAFLRGSWARAWRLLAKVDRTGSLDPPDLERLATAAYMLGRSDGHVDGMGRAHRDYRRERDFARAARCAFWAGLNLAMRGRAADASGWFEQARRVARRTARDSVEQGYLLIPDVLQRAAEKDWNGVAKIATRAERIAERHDDDDLFAMGAHEHGHALVRLGRVTEGLRKIDEVMASVTAGGLSPVATGLVYCSVIAYCQNLFQLGRAQAWTRALTDWCERQPEMVAHTGQCLIHRAEVMQLRGEWSAALREALRAKLRFLQLTNHSAAGYALYRQAEVQRLRGRFERAESAFRQAARHGYEPQPGLALLRLAQGRSRAAAGSIGRVLAETEDPLRRARLLPASVEIHLACGNRQGAQEACIELEKTAGGRASAMLNAFAAHARGAVELAEGRPAAALHHLRSAAEEWRKLQAPYEVARVGVLISEACTLLGDDDAAGLELDASRSAFVRLDAGPDVARVEAVARNARTRSPGGLTRRELEVLRHVASGRSNKAIARILALSSRTVDRHVSNVLDKLGTSSRTAATAFAYRHRLL